MVLHEEAAATAATGAQTDQEGMRKGWRLFCKEFQAFLSASRTVWNYLIKAARQADCKDWLDERLSGRLFVLHRDLTDQDLHSYQVEPGVNQTVRWQSEPGTPMVQTAFGLMPARMTIVGFEGVRYRYEPKNLEPHIAKLLEGVTQEYGTSNIIVLATKYHEGLSQVLKSALRRGRFNAA